MEKIEFKKFTPSSVFKTILYILIVPSSLFIIGGLIVLLVGIGVGEPSIVAAAVPIMLLYPLMFIVIYGLFGMLYAVVYNALAKRFGGLEAMIELKAV
ncbi:hypothetical protein [Chengkuizengella axinellae]|uniref:DUF3566 domain-containing protein n=1 Tax=Chengkuizengella axinellae TaxID=3064388 RepID=A0ABT9IUD1_9BACL|nr:hypothetical protein [Chengkuizengella sp. 2205SS18-9]MDP5272893.1 hypothetical protein [Chengkuizengella sp. 2205SS18-9]